MSQPFKNLLNLPVIEAMASCFHEQYSPFDHAGFAKAAGHNLETLELKQRSDQITEAMFKFLPSDFALTQKIILNSLGPTLGDNISGGTTDSDGINGWAIIPITHYVGRHGFEHFPEAMQLFKALTQRSTSEFGIRHFILQDAEKTLATLQTWINDDDQHVRRLVSEGIRPRLPWGVSFPDFIQDPSPILPLLEALKDDDEEYVRRSVANNLNDIAKDHPELVADIASQWIQDASPNRLRLIKHGCRTLIKNGHKKTLLALGFKTPKACTATLGVLTPAVSLGEHLSFTLTLATQHKTAQPIILDYIIHHQKKNGTTTAKVFKWKTITLTKEKPMLATKKHAMKPITTRVYYPGTHAIEIMINGVSIARQEFQLLIP